ncbi:B- and T-lymphocyte attenuator-like isoform X2 [Hypomesus transpacificus]|uniref:B- and T-lymphocyte attenuator-like isoform X2 n=1 Tax=Hypomesus transpacificus TaxID=137520 RepID=UPI001F084A62|nr:B- and T-lymphocyte attenuator-like isoform X2 [Hypomesus transpacificus]
MFNNYFGKFFIGIILLHLGMKTKGQEADCLPHVRVHRNTVMNASSGEDLRMECPVHFCSDAQPVISWCKLDDSNNCSPFNRSARTETHWQNLTYNTGISFLNMKDVSTNDTGQYRCQYRSDLSHSIKIIVSERADITTTLYEKTEKKILHDIVNVAWIVLFTVLTVVCMVLFGCWALRDKGKTCSAPVPPLEGTAMQAMSGTPEVQSIIERAVETDSLTGIDEDYVNDV